LFLNSRVDFIACFKQAVKAWKKEKEVYYNKKRKYEQEKSALV